MDELWYIKRILPAFQLRILSNFHVPVWVRSIIFLDVGIPRLQPQAGKAFTEPAMCNVQVT